MGFQHPSFEVTETSQRISIDFGTCVLRHYQSVLVIEIGQTKRILRQVVEELFLSFQIILYRLMIVQMVTGEIGEDTSGEF